MKSNVSDLLRLAEAVYKDATANYTADLSDLRDLETLRSRVEKEGLSFLTITLPAFCSDFERSLADGQIDSKYFRNFRKYRAIPAFLQGMLSRLFDVETGRILDETEHNNSVSIDHDAPRLVECVRQICLTFKKLKVGCTLQRVHQAMVNFSEIEHALQEFSLSKEDAEAFSSVSSELWHNAIKPIRLNQCRPKHGPGATAEHISGNQKYAWRNWHDRLEPYFSIVGDGYPLGIPSTAVELEKLSIIPEGLEQPVRVVPVPKTLKGPRIIAIEPCCMQFVQQGIRDVLYGVLDSYWLTAGHINFSDQRVNQKLAIESSKNGLLATIDLSDASDRVPRLLALDMFDSNPDLRDAIDACRSTSAELPDGTIISPLRKFASMGSALCFPIEAMYFYTICVVALLEANHLPVSASNIFFVTRDLYVYGDDIIVPSAYADVVLDHLRKYNCKVNANKTFVTGRFRESCGIDAYQGEVVTPTYLRELCPENQRQPERVISWTATANLFYKRGYWRTADLMFNRIERVIGPLPYLSDDDPGLGRVSYLGYRSIGRWNEKLHRLEVRAMVPSPIYRTDKMEGYGALSKSLLKLEDLKPSNSSESQGANPWLAESEYSQLMCGIASRSGVYSSDLDRDAQHLERFALHGAVVIKRRWVPASYGWVFGR